MKTVLIAVSAFALSIATAFVVAQTAPAPAPPAAAAPPPPASPTPPAQNALPPVPPTSVDNTVGANPPPSPMPQNGGNAGTNMQGSGATGGGYGGATSGMSASSITPFELLDRDKAGSLTLDQARGDPWLSQHFTQCDANHDDQVTQKEYATCSTQAGR